MSEVNTTETTPEATPAPAAAPVSPLAALGLNDEQLAALGEAIARVTAPAPTAAPAAPVVSGPDPRDAQIAELQQQLAAQQALHADFQQVKDNVGHLLSKVQPVKDIITFLEGLL